MLSGLRVRDVQTGRWENWESLSELGWTLLITADLFIAHTLRIQVQAHSNSPKQQAPRQQGSLAAWQEGGQAATARHSGAGHRLRMPKAIFNTQI